MMDFSSLTTAELERVRTELIKEFNKRKDKERDVHKEELVILLKRVNELQEKYDFQIGCRNELYEWVSSATELELNE